MKKIIKLSKAPDDTSTYATLKVQNGFIIMNGSDIHGYDFECGNCDQTLATGIFHE